MIKLILALNSVFAIMAISNAASIDKDNHQLVNLWASYYVALKADRVQDQIKALDIIKKKASEQRLSWDFYDACDKYEKSLLSTNWKLRTELSNQKANEIKEYDEAIVTYFFHRYESTASLLKEITNNKAKLEQSCNPGFYSRGDVDRLMYADALAKLIDNDYDFVLWNIFSRGYSDILVKPLLDSRYGGNYPFGAFVEFSLIDNERSSNNSIALKKFASKYSGKAVALLAKDRLLEMELDSLIEKDASSQEFISLKNSCDALNKEKKSFFGTERSIAACCKSPDNIIKQLNSKDIFITAQGREAEIHLRNLGGTRVELNRNDKNVFRTSIFNLKQSYYALDTLNLSLPDIDDGEYDLVCKSKGKQKSTIYQKYTLSLAVREDASGYSVFVADYESGEPIKTCTLSCLDDNNKVIKSREVQITDGFARIPDLIPDGESGFKSYQLQAMTRNEGRLRLSKTHFLYSSFYKSHNTTEINENKYAMIITDKSVYTPDETVHYKIVLYSKKSGGKVIPSVPISIKILDPEDKEIECLTHTTNEFGSAEGEFKAKKESRSGDYSIVVFYENETLRSSSVLINEFVLPSFDLEWEKNLALIFPGEEIRVKGRLKSYSGKNLSSVSATYEVDNYGEVFASDKLNIDKNGNFAFSFTSNSKKASYYSIAVKVTDATGETLSFSNGIMTYENLPFSVKLENAVKGELNSKEIFDDVQEEIVSEDCAKLSFNISDYYLSEKLFHTDIKTEWFLKSEGIIVAKGEAVPNSILDISLDGLESGRYLLECQASVTSSTGQNYDSKEKLVLIKLKDTDTIINFDAICIFKEIKGEQAALQIGASCGPIWAVADLYGKNGVLLDHKLVYLSGEKGKDNSLDVIRFEHKKTYPKDMKLNVLLFRDSNEYEYSMQLRNTASAETLPLVFTRFVDTTAPSTNYSFEISTKSGVECAAAIFDKSIETISDNEWYTINTDLSDSSPVNYYETSGCVHANDGGMYNTHKMMGDVLESDIVTNAMTLSDTSMSSRANDVEDNTQVRENFASTIAWEPLLRSDEDGRILLNFKTADKLSTYCVQLFAHDIKMHNATLRKEMLVTIPVQIGLVEPQHLYSGDDYIAKVTVSNNFTEDVSGTISIRFMDSANYQSANTILEKSKSITVAAGSSVVFECEIETPSVEHLGMLISFISNGAGNSSDKVFVSIPVAAPVQTITESHSALLKSEMEREALVQDLRKKFVNVDDAKAQIKERSILDLLYEAIPSAILPKSDNLIDLTEALYADYLLSKLPKGSSSRIPEDKQAEIVSKILACRNSNGGFGWFANMSSSPVITTAVLERLLKIKDGLPSEISAILPAAAKYLDNYFFDNIERPMWCGGISLGQYLHVRALCPETPFSVKDSKELRKFKTSVNKYLVPSSERGLNGQILEKALRLETLRKLNSSNEGLELAFAWGIDKASSLKLSASIRDDIESLAQYAIAHSSGGTYYPNAVMPWRGLMESELYAHSLLCDLMDKCGHKDIADGIRLWIMIQKETQRWDTDPAVLEALGSVLQGSEATLSCSILSLSADATKPFEAIKASSNGISIQKEYTRNGASLKEGDIIKVGDIIRARYSIYNEENRSFVKICIPRPAALRPVEQISGRYSWQLRSLRVDGWMMLTPQGYREVSSDRTEYWFDSYPEEHSVITEDFYVTQQGCFQSPCAEIESLYAPHYRGNDMGQNKMKVEAL